MALANLKRCLVDFRPSPEQLQLCSAFADLYADHATAAAVAAAEPAGYDVVLWRHLAATGALEMALPEAAGGYGASLLDLALVAEQHGRAVAPAPLIEAQVTARLLGRLEAYGSRIDAADVARGTRIITLGLRAAVGNLSALTPAGAVAHEAIVFVDDQLVLVPLSGRATPVRNLGCLPLADVTITGDEVVLARGPEAVEHFDGAVDEWRVLTAAALAGMAASALEIGVAYVKERKAFGKPVGQFQSVAHRLADRATEVDGAQLLSREAAWAADEDPVRMHELASMALAFSAETAIATSHDALHFHGGYGFMLEYPIQHHYRRARTWGAVLESPSLSYQRVGRDTLAAVGAEKDY